LDKQEGWITYPSQAAKLQENLLGENGKAEPGWESVKKLCEAAVGKDSFPNLRWEQTRREWLEKEYTRCGLRYGLA
jgi:hypothetical protein